MIIGDGKVTRQPEAAEHGNTLLKSNARQGARLRRLTTGSPLPALLVDRVAPVPVFSARGG